MLVLMLNRALGLNFLNGRASLYCTLYSTCTALYNTGGDTAVEVEVENRKCQSPSSLIPHLGLTVL
jgi:hypothetical protein